MYLLARIDRPLPSRSAPLGALRDEEFWVCRDTLRLLRDLRDSQSLQETAALHRLIELYDRSPGGQGFASNDDADAQAVRIVGNGLYLQGGDRLMQQVFALFARDRPENRRNLELVWHGVGDWRGSRTSLRCR